MAGFSRPGVPKVKHIADLRTVGLTNVCPNVCPFYLLYICFVPEDLKSEVMWSWVCKIQITDLRVQLWVEDKHWYIRSKGRSPEEKKR